MRRTTIVTIGLGLLLALPASAQVPRIPGAVSSGISVIGRATIRVPADGLRLNAYILGDVDEGDRKAILAQLRSGGLDSPQLFESSFINAQGGSTQLRGIVRHATLDKLNALARVAADIAAAHPKLKVGNATLVPFVDDCTAVEAKVRRAAFEDAKHRAEDIANVAGIKLGPIDSVVETPSTCMTNAQADAFQNGPGGGFFSLDADPVVSVTMTENVIYGSATQRPILFERK